MADTLLKVENLVKEYDGQRILDGIDLTLAQGEVVVVVGPSGCGKSTLLRCINALEPVQDGSISLHGKDIRKGSKNITEMRQKIGMVFQSYELFPHLTVLDNITLSPVKVQKRKKDEVKAEHTKLEHADSAGVQKSSPEKSQTAVKHTAADTFDSTGNEIWLLAGVVSIFAMLCTGIYLFKRR